MEAHHGSVTPTQSDAASESPRSDEPAVAAKELAHLAALLRRAVTNIDAEARERLEGAWVALTSALKQPKHDASRIATRLARLRGEVDRIIAGEPLSSGDDADLGETGPGRST